MSVTYLEHYPYSLQHNGKQIIRVHGIGAPGEKVALAFSLSSQTSCPLVELHPQALSGPQQKLDAQCIDLHIVKVWQQAGIGIYQSESMNVPELLLKDDRVNLRDGYRRHFKRKRHLIEPFRLYEPPSVRLDGCARTSLKAGQTKQILIEVGIPPATAPGLYEGSIRVIVPRQADPVESATPAPAENISITLEVLPISLLAPKQDLMIWYKGSLNWRNSQHYVSEKTFRLQLRDIYDTGFRSLSINEIDTQGAQTAISIAEEIGFDGYVVLSPASVDPAKLLFRSLKPVYIISDELDLHVKHSSFVDVEDDPSVKAHKLNLDKVKHLADRQMCTIYHEPTATELFSRATIGAAPAIVSYSLPMNREFFFFRKQFPQLQNREVYFYWPAHMEKPNLSRVLAGLYLWKTGAAGIQPYCYQHLPKYPFSPFNDFDEWEPNSDLGPNPRVFRDHMVTYPSKNGPIPTLQWRGMREGITDLKYLTTLESALVEAESHADSSIATEAAGIRECIREFLDKIGIRSINITSETEAEPYKEVPPEAYQRFREYMARSIIRLQKHDGISCGGTLTASGTLTGKAATVDRALIDG